MRGKITVYLFTEHDIAKDKTRTYEYRKWVVEEWVPYIEKKKKEIGFKTTGLADNTGHIMGLYEFEDMDALAKLWNDEEYHTIMRHYYTLVDNLKIRLCRPAKVIPP